MDYTLCDHFYFFFKYTDFLIISILSQVDIPNILKQRRQLAKLVLDYDSARTRSRFYILTHMRLLSIHITVSVIASHLVLNNNPNCNPCCLSLRWLQATKSIISGTNTQALTAKADSLKEEMDEAMNKMELCKVMNTSRLSFHHSLC